METNVQKRTLEYNTERVKLQMPEYGRNVLRMVEQLKTIPDKAKRSEQAKAVIKAMELLNPSVHSDEHWEQKLWDHLHIISNFELDIDSPYAPPEKETLQAKPLAIPLQDKPIKATHYGRNIESIIELIATEPDGEQKASMIRQLAIYMRQQYLIWNKDSVADQTIFEDIERLSRYRIKVPEGLSLSRISSDANFSRPGLNLDMGQKPRKQSPQKKNFQRKGQKGR